MLAIAFARLLRVVGSECLALHDTLLVLTSLSGGASASPPAAPASLPAQTASLPASAPPRLQTLGRKVSGASLLAREAAASGSAALRPHDLVQPRRLMLGVVVAGGVLGGVVLLQQHVTVRQQVENAAAPL